MVEGARNPLAYCLQRLLQRMANFSRWSQIPLKSTANFDSRCVELYYTGDTLVSFSARRGISFFASLAYLDHDRCCHQDVDSVHDPGRDTNAAN